MIEPGDCVLFVDDVLATDGTALATVKLVELLSGSGDRIVPADT